ncbi:MAG: 50S ribosomal protein L24 [Bacilli bacterium]|nr:50S ribosomal protein L24 [Bacilli bacterium]
MKLKTGDKVTVIAGANSGSEGKIIKIVGEKVIIEGVNIVTKHIKPKNNNGNGEIIKTEAPIHRSNIKVIEVAKEKKKTAKKVSKKEEKTKNTAEKKTTKSKEKKEEK